MKARYLFLSVLLAAAAPPIPAADASVLLIFGFRLAYRRHSQAVDTDG